MIGGKAALRSVRPESRRPPFDELEILRIRVDLDGAEPPIWRRLDVRSDLTLDDVHQVLQVAFDWTDSHLHRFSLGGHAFDRTSQLFLCPYDAEEGEFDDQAGIPASDVRLDETLQESGDVLNYLYDYGDNWELTLRLEEVLPASPDAPSAVAVAGRRAAPPEDSGGGTDLASIALKVDDPAHLDLNELNQALRAPHFMLREYGVDERLVDLVNRLRHTSVGEDLAARALTLVSEPTHPLGEEMLAALQAYIWFLDRAKDGGIELTSAGYLKPADVQAASRVVPTMGDWIGKNNRESLAAPLLDFRQSLQSIGLLRKYKGSLLLTRVGASAQRDPRRLWDLFADKLIPVADGFDRDATLLLLAYAASSADHEVPLKPIAEALTHLGWRHRDGRALQDYELYRLRAFDTLMNVSDQQAERGGRRVIRPAAAALASAALRRCRRRRDELAAGNTGADEVEHVGGVQPRAGRALRGPPIAAPNVDDAERLVGAGKARQHLTRRAFNTVGGALQPRRPSAVPDPGESVGPRTEVLRQQPVQHLLPHLWRQRAEVQNRFVVPIAGREAGRAVLKR